MNDGIGPSIKAAFEPLEDITAYEIAFVVANLSLTAAPSHGVWFTQDKWDGLPDPVKRHFRVCE